MIGALACRYLGTTPARLLGTLLAVAPKATDRNEHGQAGLALAPNIEEFCASF